MALRLAVDKSVHVMGCGSYLVPGDLALMGCAGKHPQQNQEDPSSSRTVAVARLHSKNSSAVPSIRAQGSWLSLGLHGSK